MKHIALVVGSVVSCFAFSCGGVGPEGPDVTGGGTTQAREDLAIHATPECQGVVGTWRGQVYSEPHAGYYDFTVRVSQPSADAPELSGTILARSWAGATEDVAPPEACNGGFHWTVVEPAVGHVADDGSLTFEGASWQVGEHFCGEEVTSYSPDKLEVVPIKDEATGRVTLSGVLTDGAVWSQTGLHIELDRVSCQAGESL